MHKQKLLNKQEYFVSNLPFIRYPSVSKIEQIRSPIKEDPSVLSRNFMPITSKKIFLTENWLNRNKSYRELSTGSFVYKKDTGVSPIHYRLPFDSGKKKRKYNTDLNEVRRSSPIEQSPSFKRMKLEKNRHIGYDPDTNQLYNSHRERKSVLFPSINYFRLKGQLWLKS